MSAILTDSRRLTGANLFWDHPAAIIDCRCDADPEPFIGRWQDAVARLLEATGQGGQRTTHRVFDGGASLLVSAPIDALYSMCELNEAAFALAGGEGAEASPASVEDAAPRLRELFREESNPPLLALQQAAHRHGAPFLWDDDRVSVGYGAGSQVWAPDRLPAPEAVDWAAARAIPVALVTGTNGKSTTVRLAAAMLRAAGMRAGLTSTDWIRIGEEIIDTGDYSGTGGARTLLRDSRTEVAVLETARGGMLRRGLGVETATTAVITNVAADHLGEYGINTVPELIEAKFIVRRALHGHAALILNADDEGVVDFARRLSQPIVWFSLDAGHPLVRERCAGGGRCAVLNDGWFTLLDGNDATRVIALADVPITLEGAARHNVRNALAALALCRELGVDVAAMARGLGSFRGDEQDNPGRGNWFEKDGVRILVDFAHNEHGMRALAEMLRRMPARRRLLLMSQAGDRRDGDIRDMVQAACEMNPDRLFVCDLPGYERGRGPGEVPAVIRAAAVDAGLPTDAVEQVATPRDAVVAAIEEARPGDLLALFVLTQRDQALQLIHEFLGEEGAEDAR